MAATGLPRSTLVHWIKEGLLPEPIRKNRTMAYYHPSMVERAVFISEIRSQGMPLKRIKELMKLKDDGVEIDSLIELHQVLFEAETGPVMDKKQFCDVTGLDPDQLKMLIDAGLIMPKESGTFNQEDATACAFYLWGVSNGIDIPDLQIIKRKIKDIVESRMAIIDRLTAGMPVEKAAEIILHLMKSMSAIQTYLGQRIYYHKVKKRNKAPKKTISSK